MDLEGKGKVKVKDNKQTPRQGIQFCPSLGLVPALINGLSNQHRTHDLPVQFPRDIQSTKKGKRREWSE